MPVFIGMLPREGGREDKNELMDVQEDDKEFKKQGKRTTDTQIIKKQSKPKQTYP